jgi:hypothetical protein
MPTTDLSYFEQQRDQAKCATLRYIEQLQLRLATIKLALDNDQRPPASAGLGDLGVQLDAATIQQQVDSWLRVADTVSVLQSMAARSGQ